MMFERRMGRYIFVCTLLWLSQLSGAVHAQGLRLALFKTAHNSADLEPLSAALDPVLQAEVGRVATVSIAALPPLDLPSLQLALDCVGETPSCLEVAAGRSKVEGLLSPSLSRSEASLVLSLLLYNPRKNAALQVVTHSFARDASDAVVIDGAKTLVQELFGLVPPAAASEPEAPTPEPTRPAEPPPQLTAPDPELAKSDSPSLLLPIVLGGAGVAVVAVGIGFGVASNNNESSYGDMRIANPSDAQNASDLLSTARSQAIISNVAFGLGIASCVAGGVVFFLQRKQRADKAPSTQVAVGPGYVGLTGGF